MDNYLIGELTGDARHIALMAVGDDPAWVPYVVRQLRLLTPLVKPSNPPGALLVGLSWPAVVQLAAVMGQRWQTGPRLTEWVQAELAARTPVDAELTVAPPDGVTPRAYQVQAARMIAATGRALLFDDPGTGKTWSAILGLVERAQVAPVLPVVCVVPASVVDPWVDTWRTLAPAWRTVAWRGEPKRRHQLAGTADIYVSSYDTARMDAANPKGPLVTLKPQGLIADEHHLIKSPHSARTMAVLRLAKKVSAFVALSGTPITHNPADLWATLTGLEPLAWPSRERWVDRYCTKIPGDYKDTILGLAPHTEAEFRTAIMGRHRRVSKQDVLTELPPKIYSTRVVEIPSAYRKAYDDMERQMLAQLPDGAELSVLSVLAQMTRLAQMASAPTDVTVTQEVGADGEEREHVQVRLKAPSWKVAALLEVLSERPDEQVVAFAPSRQLIVLAGQAASAAGLRVGYVMGGQSMSERTETVARFQSGELDLLCATTGAGGVGLTLTAARTVVFLQRPWSLVDALQAEDRCHRLGSEVHDSIDVIDIRAANTIDTRIRAVLKGKAGQLSELLQDPRIVAALFGGTPAQRADAND